MPPLEEGVASRKPRYLLCLLSPTTVRGTGQEPWSGEEGCSARNHGEQLGAASDLSSATEEPVTHLPADPSTRKKS